MSIRIFHRDDDDAIPIGPGWRIFCGKTLKTGRWELLAIREIDGVRETAKDFRTYASWEEAEMYAGRFARTLDGGAPGDFHSPEEKKR